MNKYNLTWRQVLDSYAPNALLWNLDDFLKMVRDTGYEYFNWNGRVYELVRLNNGMLGYTGTGITIEELS
jgi:hypothetical protein